MIEAVAVTNTLRLFVAVNPSPASVSLFGETIDRLRPTAPQAKWVHSERLHVTLAFLGDTEETKLVSVTAAVKAVAAEHAPFALRFEGGGLFWIRRQPQILWAGIGGDVPALCRVRDDLTKRLESIGYAPEHRAYSPHLTLARAANPGGDEALLSCAKLIEGQSFGETTIREVVLYKSEPSSRGPMYTALLCEPFRV